MSAAFIALSLGNAVYVASGFMRSGLGFRLGTMLASVILAIWGAITDNLGVIGWNSAFVVVNTWQTIRLLRQNSARLTDEEAWIRTRHFPTLSTRDFLAMWSAGDEAPHDPGAAVRRHGVFEDDVLLLLDGDISITTPNAVEHIRSAPCFIGEMSYLTGAPASADVVALSDLRVRRWSRQVLDRLHATNGACDHAWQVALGVDVATKLGDV